MISNEQAHINARLSHAATGGAGIPAGYEFAKDPDNNPNTIAAITQARQFIQQLRQGRTYRFPHHFKVDLEITMGNPVTHAAQVTPWHIGMPFYKLRIMLHHLGSGFADNNQTHHHCLLRPLIRQKFLLLQTFDKSTSVNCRLLYVIQIVGKTINDHTGLASAKTCWRNLLGRTPGTCQ